MNSSAPTSTPRVDKSEARIREMFGEISGRYDLLNHLLSGGTDAYWRWRTIHAVPPQENLPILDVCTGTGDLALAYRRAAGGRFHVIGVDFAHSMLVRARRKAERAGRPTSATMEFMEADAQRLPFADNSFQIVSVAFGLRNVTSTQRGLEEMARVCAPGGRVAVLEFSMPANRLVGAVYRFYFRNVLPRIGQWISGSRQDAYRYLPDSVSQFPSGPALAAMMESAGLDSVRFTPLTFGIATLYVGTKGTAGPTGTKNSVAPALDAN